MIEYNQRWFTKDKEGRGEKELLEEISKNNEKSRPSRAKPDGEGDPEMAKILLSLTKVKGKEATATVMAELPPSVRGHNRDDFDDEKNEAEEEADGEKNNGNDDNDDGGELGTMATTTNGAMVMLTTEETSLTTTTVKKLMGLWIMTILRASLLRISLSTSHYLKAKHWSFSWQAIT